MRYGICFSLAVVLAGCNSQAGNLSGKVHAVTTTSMITDMVQAIGGDRVVVTGLMGPGIDPHGYQASADDIEKLSQGDIIFYNGLHLEGQMGEIFERMSKRRKTVPVTKGIDVKDLRQVEGFEGSYDPHVWFDVKLWMKAAETVRDELSTHDPAGASVYQANAKKYLAEMEKLDVYVREQVNTLKLEQRVLVTAHDAFGYFGRAYGFEVHGLQGVSTVEEAGPKAVQQLAEFIAERKVPALFVESSVNQKNMAAVQAAVQARGWTVTFAGSVKLEEHTPMLYSDALGNPGTPDGTYVGMVKHNVDTIVRALKK